MHQSKLILETKTSRSRSYPQSLHLTVQTLHPTVQTLHLTGSRREFHLFSRYQLTLAQNASALMPRAIHIQGPVDRALHIQDPVDRAIHIQGPVGSALFDFLVCLLCKSVWQGVAMDSLKYC
jgi:hypothetical protein